MKIVDTSCILEAHIWNTNNDLPGEHRGTIIGGLYQGEPYEGNVVRYYRNPDVKGGTICPDCGNMFHIHGWIDQGIDGLTVCPGNVVIRNNDGSYSVKTVSEIIEHYTVIENNATMVSHSFQQRLWDWFTHTFGEVFPALINDKRERSHRFIEEALELVQACDMDKEELLQLVHQVYNKPKGDIFKEIGGTFTTLTILCQNHDIDINEAAEAELKRNWTIIDKLRSKQPFRSSMVSKSK